MIPMTAEQITFDLMSNQTNDIPKFNIGDKVKVLNCDFLGITGKIAYVIGHIKFKSWNYAVKIDGHRLCLVHESQLMSADTAVDWIEEKI